MLVTVVVPPAPPTDVRLVVHDGATTDDLLAALHRHAASHGLPPPSPELHVDGHRLPPGAPLRSSGLRRGATVEVSPAVRHAGHDASAHHALAVVGGPRAGHLHPLAPGRHVLGRAWPPALDHPSVSRRHVELALDDRGRAVLHDLGSRNGTAVDGAWVLGPTAVPDGSEVRVGALVLAVRPRRRRRPRAVEPATGTTPLHRPPRPAGPAPPAPPTLPAGREPGPARTPLSWSATLVPVLVGLVLAAAFGPLFAAFALLGPLAAVGGWAEHRLRRRRHRRREDRRISTDCRRLAAALTAASAATRTWRQQRHPDLAELADRAASADPILWERRPGHDDALLLRLGTGPVDAPAATEPARGRVPHEPEVAAVLAAHRSVADAPIAVDLGRHVLGVVGPSGAARAVARALVVQAVVLHGPADLGLAVPTTPAWSWARWLPHQHRGEQPWRLVVHDAAAEPRAPAPPAIVLATAEHALPAGCTAVLTTDGHGAGRLADLAAPGPGLPLLVDATTEEVAARAARDLAHLEDPERRSHPTHDRSAPLAALNPGSAAAVEAAWTAPDDGLAVVIGVAPDTGTPVEVDLVADGPHALVAGTTGSGKSELLRSLVVGLATRTSTDRLAFVLVDLKGGSAFDRCTDLPHVVGTVTDLDEAMVRRVLHGLDAEVRRREQHLRTAGHDELAAYQRSADGAHDPLPRLVVVVDEFGVLADVAPDALAGIVDLAQRGRSLGIHLVLATQRAAGVVTDRIRANTSLRVALRTVDAADSHDLVGVGDAAAIDRRTPGRAVLRCGGDDARVVQVASTLHPAADDAGPAVEVRPATGPQAAGDPRHLERLVAEVRAAHVRSGRRHPRRPWADPLPALVEAERLPPAPVGHLVLGLADDRATQRTVPWCWEPDGGHLVVHGAAGSGVTSTVAAAARAAHADGWRVHVVDPLGSLLAHPTAPAWAGVVAPGDPDGLAALLDRLRAAEGVVRTVVAVDRWHALAATLDDLAGMRLLDDLVRALARGPAAGVVAVLGLDRTTGLPAALAPAAAQRLVLRVDDPHDLGLLGVAVPPEARTTLPGAPPGRGIATPAGLEVQVATWTCDGPTAGTRP